MPENTDSERPNAPRGGGLAYLDTQRAALRELLELSSTVVDPIEAEIEQRLRDARATADKTLSEATAETETQFRQDLAEAEQAHAGWVAQVEKEYEAAQDTLANNTRKSLERSTAEFREIEREARRQKEDSLLIVETVAESTINGLRKDFQALQRQVITQRERLKSLGTRTARLLEEYGHEPEPIVTSAAEHPAPQDDFVAVHERCAKEAADHLAALQMLSTPQLFVGARPYVLLTAICVAAVGLVGVLSVVGIPRFPSFFILGPVVLVVALVLSLLIGRNMKREAHAQIREEYEPIQRALSAAQQALDLRLASAAQQLKWDEAQALQRRDDETRATNDRCRAVVAEAEQRHSASRNGIESARAARQEKLAQRRVSVLQQSADEHGQKVGKLRAQYERDTAGARRAYEQRIADCQREYGSARAALEARWSAGLTCIRQLLDETDALDLQRHFDWSAGAPAQWAPPDTFAALAPFGHWRVDLSQLAASVRGLAPFLDARPAQVSTPALLYLPEKCSLLLETERTGRPEAISALRAIMLRLLTSLPPGRVHFTIIDPVGLGENFAGFMHLVDYEEALVGGRIWTESDHIEARLTELTSHMENVIQKYLRNEFETIDAYNEQAGELAEPYRFLVIADFPANFNEGAARRLNSIFSSGPRCGVFTLIARDKRLPTPPDVRLEDLQNGSVHLVHEGDRFVYQDELLRQFPLTLYAPPTEEVLTQIMHAVGRGAKDSLRVEVPFESIAPSPAQCWSGDASNLISAPLGHTGAVRLQHLRLGRGMAQHVLIAGKTGSGKSTLLHVLVTNLALWYNPDEIEFYLVDFKKGVEFKTYVTHQLPHARAIAIESDREFGVSVLQRLDAEMARRGELFRAAGVQDLPAYRAVADRSPPRTLLIVDEFQVFFTEDDKLAQEAMILLDRLVRQGRAFGIHVLLGSQTLGGTSGLARSTMGQMAVRIALQCSEADSQLILDDTNVAARLLSRPGEAIYNDAGGLVEGNSPFQTAWLPDEQRITYLQRIAAFARARGSRCDPPVVFEGNAPADVRQNRLLARLLDAREWPAASAAQRAWLGEAVAIKDPTSVTFKRQSGSNLLLVGQRDAAALAMMANAMLCLAAGQAPHAARFVILDGRPADGARQADGFRDVAARLPHEVQFVGWREVAAVLAEIARETQRRLDTDQTDAPAIYVLVYALQRYRMLRRQNDNFTFSVEDEEKPPAPDAQFAELLREGPSFGVHVLAWADTLATLDRTLDRQALGEFDNRVLFQMSAADSSNLIDTPEANQLGLYRALLYSEERGLLEKFRPYAAPDADWLAYAEHCLARRLAPGQT
ncbi:MAG: cell division protein FtsK [Planctomycetes bacterium]|nr:cell division protein FtsK [Planctomycetota bacterium]